MTGVSVSGLCSKDVSYRPVKMSLLLQPAATLLKCPYYYSQLLQPPGVLLSVLLQRTLPLDSIAVQ